MIMNAETQDKVTEWPKHPDGRNKKLGEMTRDEQREAIKPALAALKKELESPEMRQAIEG